MREQVVILRVRYDPEESDPPETWEWPTLLDCDPDDVEVLMSGGLLPN